MSDEAQVVDKPAIAQGATALDAQNSAPWRITKENARIKALKSWALRRERAAQRVAERAEQTQSNPPEAGTPTFLTARIGQVEAEIERQHGLLAKTKEPKEVKDLAMAIDRLYQTWSLLTGHERPGVRRAKSRREQTNQTPLVVLPKEVGSQ